MKYKSIPQMFRTIFVEEGIIGFWKGAGSGMVYYAAFNAIEFAVYKQALDYTRNAFVSGAIASSAAMLLTYPMDIIRTRMSLSLHNNLLTVIQSMLRHEGGVMAFYRGLSMTMVQVVPGMTITFGVHHQLRDGMGDWWAASLAAILSKTLVMPLDVLRKRHQIRLNTLKLVMERTAKVKQHTFMWKQLQELWRREGVRGSFAGWTMAVMKAAPAAAITFTVYGLCHDNKS